MHLPDIKTKAAKLTDSGDSHTTPSSFTTLPTGASTTPSSHHAEHFPAATTPAHPPDHVPSIELCLPTYDHTSLMKTPDVDLSPEQARLKSYLRLLDKDDAKLSLSARNMKKQVLIMNTDDADLNEEDKKIKRRMILMVTPDEQLTVEQQKDKKRVLKGSKDSSVGANGVLAGVQALAWGILGGLS